MTANPKEAFATTSSAVADLWEQNAPIWTELVRDGHDVYRDHLNTPSFMALLPDVMGLNGLDIGCGEGTNTRKLAQAGAAITAIDIAPSFIRYAQESEDNDPLGISYSVGDATDLPFVDGQFDFATSFMCMMDVANADRAVAEAYRVIRGGGFFQFSILHPCLAPPVRKTLRDENGDVYGVELAEYFEENDGKVEEWTFSSAKRAGIHVPQPFRVPRFHRTLSNWINMLIEKGFVIERIAEPRACEKEVRLYPQLSDTRIVPLFIQFLVRKPNEAF